VSRAPFSSRVFAVLGALLLVAAVVLAVLGSFVYVHMAAVGTISVAAALMLGGVHRAFPRAAAVISLVGVGLVLVGLVLVPLTYLRLVYAGWGLIAAAAILVVLGRDASTA